MQELTSTNYLKGYLNNNEVKYGFNDYSLPIKNLLTDKEAKLFIESRLDSKSWEEEGTPFNILKTYFTDLKDEKSAYDFLSKLDELSLSLKQEVRKTMNVNPENNVFLMKALAEEIGRNIKKETVGDYYEKNIKDQD